MILHVRFESNAKWNKLCFQIHQQTEIVKLWTHRFSWQSTQKYIKPRTKFCQVTPDFNQKRGITKCARRTDRTSSLCETAFALLPCPSQSWAGGCGAALETSPSRRETNLCWLASPTVGSACSRLYQRQCQEIKANFQELAEAFKMHTSTDSNILSVCLPCRSTDFRSWKVATDSS